MNEELIIEKGTMKNFLILLQNVMMISFPIIQFIKFMNTYHLSLCLFNKSTNL